MDASAAIDSAMDASAIAAADAAALPIAATAAAAFSDGDAAIAFAIAASYPADTIDVAADSTGVLFLLCSDGASPVSTGVAKKPKTEFQEHIQMAKALSNSLAVTAPVETADLKNEEVTTSDFLKTVCVH